MPSPLAGRVFQRKVESLAAAVAFCAWSLACAVATTSLVELVAGAAAGRGSCVSSLTPAPGENRLGSPEAALVASLTGIPFSREAKPPMGCSSEVFRPVPTAPCLAAAGRASAL